MTPEMQQRGQQQKDRAGREIPAIDDSERAENQRGHRQRPEPESRRARGKKEVQADLERHKDERQIQQMRVKVNENKCPERKLMHRKRHDFMRAAKIAVIQFFACHPVSQQKNAVEIAENAGKDRTGERNGEAPRQVVGQCEDLQHC